MPRNHVLHRFLLHCRLLQSHLLHFVPTASFGPFQAKFFHGAIQPPTSIQAVLGEGCRHTQGWDHLVRDLLYMAGKFQGGLPNPIFQSSELTPAEVRLLAEDAERRGTFDRDPEHAEGAGLSNPF